MCPRIGIVLGSGGGALAKMAALFKYFVGGILGSGEQWMSWIHLDDVLGLISRFLDDAAIMDRLTRRHPIPCATVSSVRLWPKCYAVPVGRGFPILYYD